MPHPRRRRSPSAPPDARDVAVRALTLVLDEGRPLEDALGQARLAALPDPRERGFARTIVATTLRRLGRIDRALAVFIARPLRDEARLARAILRAGAAQLLFLDTPAYAAVDRMTALAQATPEARPFKGLINAVLRRVSERGKDAIADAAPIDDWPAWLTARWADAYGPETAQALAAASAAEPPLDLTVKSDPEHWAGVLGGSAIPFGGVRLEGGDPARLPGFDEGAWWVQDAAAALPARLLLNRLGDPQNARVLDLCAAPGGKTLQLAAAGARVTAVDRSERRLERLAQNLERTRLAAEIVAADAAEFTPDAPFDAVLVDAPCTATGTLRRRPDVAWLKRARDVAALAPVQAAIIASAAAAVRPGGTVVYCTCSLEPEEGPGALASGLEAAAANGAPLAIDPIRSDELPELPAEAFQPDGSVRTFPSFWADRGGMDGFFIARLTRSD